MSISVAFYSGTNSDSSIYMTWNTGRIVNTTPTIVPFQNEPSKSLEGCSITPRLVRLFCYTYNTVFLLNCQTWWRPTPPRARSHKMNLLRSWILSTRWEVRLLVSYSSLTLLTFNEDVEKITDPYSIWVVGTTIPRYVVKWCWYHMKHD